MNAQTKQETTALTVIERASLALGSSGKAKELMIMAQSSKAIVAITNPASYQECHAARMALKNERIAIAKQGKEARDDATKFSKAVIAEEARLIGLIEPEETRLQAIQDAHDAKIESEKAAKVEAEANRIAEIQRKISTIVAFPSTLQGSTAAEIEMAAKVFISQPAVENWAMEFSTIASSHFEATVNTLSLMRAGAEAQEKAKAEEEARIQAEREELVRLRAEQEERNRQEAAQRAEAERIAKAQREADERQTKALRDAEEARIAEDRARLDAEAKRLSDIADAQELEQKRIDEERARIQAEEEARAAAKVKAEQDEALAQVVASEQKSTDAMLDRLTPAILEARRAEPSPPPPDNGNTLKLGDLNSLFGFTVTADFLESRGFRPVRVEKQAKLYRQCDLPMICRSISQHLLGIAESYSIREAA